MAADDRARIVSARYSRAIGVTVAGVVATWHAGYDLIILARSWRVYDPKALVVAAWAALAAVQVAGAVLVLRSPIGTRTVWALAAAAQAASAMAIAAYPPGGVISDVSWASNTLGWTGVLLFLQRPLGGLVAFLAVNMGVMAARMAYDGTLDEVALARLVTVSYTTAGVQFLFAWLAQQLQRTARQVAAISGQRSESLARSAAQDAVHAERQRRYDYLRTRVAPLLHGLADRRLDPQDEAVRQRAAVEAARMRRLFAETDDAPHPLLHELRACADVAERRAVAVTLLGFGELPPLPREVRRDLAAGPMLALAAARTWARLTVVATAEYVVVSVLADATAVITAEAGGALPLSVVHDEEEQRLWVESRWKPPGSP
ncbi:hypothetical protein [Actinomadura fibrosa]|uniref:Histidine kinase n=1 Tax=Actinomadura fibrosa TaxID=111802 RepID=A0ABW2XWB6_9ACTN|nr:hypothetical protein [Actinomadura fibrosa]